MQYVKKNDVAFTNLELKPILKKKRNTILIPLMNGAQKREKTGLTERQQ